MYEGIRAILYKVVFHSILNFNREFMAVAFKLALASVFYLTGIVFRDSKVGRNFFLRQDGGF